MQRCTYCGEELLSGPTIGRTTYRWCLCMRHWTLDGYEVIEPPEYWAGTDGLRWIRRWVDSHAQEVLSERAWRRWFRTEWLVLHPEG